jgi:hypothetical protein
MSPRSPLTRMDTPPRFGSTAPMLCTKPADPSGRPTGDAGTCDRTSPSRDDALVVVQRDWNGWRSAMVLVADLEDVHWSRPGGAPCAMIHATVRCNRLVAGDIAHECHLTPPPHRLVVCLLKRHTAAGVFEELARRADERSARSAEFQHEAGAGGDGAESGTAASQVRSATGSEAARK